MSRYKIIADLHTHSIASTHAYSTLKEMAASANEKGMYALAVTDHARLMPGSPGSGYFSNMAASIPRNYQGVLFIAGAEGNVSDFEGSLDISRHDYENLDWIVASIHAIPSIEGINNPDIEKSTNLWMNVAKNPYVRIIGHSGDPLYEYDYEKVIPVFAENDKLIEINSHSFDVRPQNIPNCRKIAEICKKIGAQIVVSSDAHSEVEVARFGNALKLLEEMDFPEELILNASRERLDAYLERHTKVFTRERY